MQAYWGMAKTLLVEAIHWIQTLIPLALSQFWQYGSAVHPF